MGFQEGIVFSPRILRNMREIASHMGVGVETVKLWLDRGAPIAVENVDGRPRYSAEAATLQAWRLEFCKGAAAL